MFYTVNFVIHLVYWAIIMSQKEHKLSKQAGAGTTDITLSIPETI